MSTFAYDLSDNELVEAYSRAVVGSANADSGLVVAMAPTFAERAQYLKAVLHARLAGEVPPVRPGAIVRFKKQPQFFTFELKGDVFIVEQVIYVGHDPFVAKKGEKWHVTLNAKVPDFHTLNWDEFEIVVSDPTTAATQPA